MDTQISVLFMDVTHVLFNSFIHQQTLVAIWFLHLPLSLLNALEIHPSGYPPLLRAPLSAPAVGDRLPFSAWVPGAGG